MHEGGAGTQNTRNTENTGTRAEWIAPTTKRCARRLSPHQLRNDNLRGTPVTIVDFGLNAFWPLGVSEAFGPLES